MSQVSTTMTYRHVLNVPGIAAMTSWMCDNHQDTDICGNFRENLSTAGLYRNISAFYGDIRKYFCISRQKITELFLYT